MVSSTRCNLEKIRIGQLQMHQSVPFAICDEQGQLLLEKGERIQSAELKLILEDLGYFARQIQADVPQPVEFSKRKKVNPFAEFEDLSLRLSALFSQLEQGAIFGPGVVMRRIFDLITQMQGLIKYDADALLGAVHLNDQFDYSVHHPMQIAILTELVLDRLKVPQKTRLSVLAAALTSNLAMNPYQKILHKQTFPLTERQRDMVRRHPIESVQQLKEVGVDDELWLTLVAQHHEKLDGSGYPAGLTGEAIRYEARLLAVADVYSAMVTPRVYRGPLRLKESLKDLIQQGDVTLDAKIIRIFITELGLYPPGIFVRLYNGELGVVVGRTSDPKSPIVASIKKSDGHFFSSPCKRKTAESHYGIQYICDTTERVQVNPALLWGLDAIRVEIRRPEFSEVSEFLRQLS